MKIQPSVDTLAMVALDRPVRAAARGRPEWRSGALEERYFEEALVLSASGTYVAV